MEELAAIITVDEATPGPSWMVAVKKPNGEVLTSKAPSSRRARTLSDRRDHGSCLEPSCLESAFLLAPLVHLLKRGVIWTKHTGQRFQTIQLLYWFGETGGRKVRTPKQPQQKSFNHKQRQQERYQRDNWRQEQAESAAGDRSWRDMQA